MQWFEATKHLNGFVPLVSHFLIVHHSSKHLFSGSPAHSECGIFVEHFGSETSDLFVILICSGAQKFELRLRRSHNKRELLISEEIYQCYLKTFNMKKMCGV